VMVRFQVVTGSEDNTCRIWDIRQRSCIYTIPAHTNLVSGVKCQPGDGRFIATSSYDNSAKVCVPLDFSIETKR